MKVTDLFTDNKQTFSFEFFPPKDYLTAVKFGINAGQLLRLSPSFVSVTYGAGGSSHDNTFKLVDYFHNELEFTCVAHYTTINATKEQVRKDLQDLKDMGIENLMLLRGDIPDNQTNEQKKQQGFNYANELIEYARSNFDFCIGAGAYPEKHQEAPNIETDIENLKRKVDAGADYLITQMFFDNNYYWDFLNKAEQKNITCRIIPGIIPITSFKQIKKIAGLSAAKIPKNIQELLEPIQGLPKEIYKRGMDIAIHQCLDLLKNGAPGLHIYTLNKSRGAIELYDTLKQSNFLQQHKTIKNLKRV